MDMSDMMSKLKSMIEEADAETCNMTEAGEYCPEHGMEECVIMPMEGEEDLEEAKGKKPDADGDGIPDWADKNPHTKGDDEDRKDESISEAKEEDSEEEDSEEEEDLEESMNITLDGPEADAMINRLLSLSGQVAPTDAHYDADTCPGCGKADCECDSECGCPEGACTCASSQEMPAMENADHDHGHETHPAEGEPVDVDTYMWKAPTGKQRIVKGTLGDNPLIKEDANKLFAKLKGDYKAYIAEAELARSNTGTDSPLTATDRDEFDKDPFAGDEPVTDGSHSPLSTIKRQSVAK